MNIAILGTRGIPNHYGGFEQFAEYLSKFLVEKGNDVTVYNSHTHPFQKAEWNGVRIEHCKDPEDKIGTVGQFVYDFNCILNARKKDFDIILQLGYTSSSVWGKMLPKKPVIITNMDGLEWKRTKFSKPVQKFIKKAEKLAVTSSDYLIADSVGIQDHIQNTYKLESKYIPYGANVFENSNPAVLEEYGLVAEGYDMLIARLEPENSIEVILEGVAAAKVKRPFLVIGKHETKFGEYLKNKFSGNENIKFLGGIYDIDKLNNLRYYSNIYFHGHTVGGTNPSLLEAMASNSLICANDNIFNKAILGEDALYFNNSKDVSIVLKNVTKVDNVSKQRLQHNIDKIQNIYSWDKINEAYLDFMQECFKKKTTT